MAGRWLLSHATACSPSFKQIARASDCSWSWLPPSWCLAPSRWVLIFSLFLLPCIMKMRSSCEPCWLHMGLWVSLPLLTTNSLPVGRQLPLCRYNLFGFQVPQGIKNSLLSGQVWVSSACRQGCSGSLCSWGGRLNGERPSSWGGQALCKRWRPGDVSRLGRNSVWSLVPFKKYLAKVYGAPTMCQGQCQDVGMQWCVKTDRIPALTGSGETPTIAKSTDK